MQVNSRQLKVDFFKKKKKNLFYERCLARQLKLAFGMKFEEAMEVLIFFRLFAAIFLT